MIHPEVLVTPDRPVVCFREPKESVNLSVELPKVLHAQGWGIGTYFNVQFISHDRAALLASAEFLVTDVRESIHTSEANPYQPMTKMVFARKYEQIGEWWEAKVDDKAQKVEEKPQTQAPAKKAARG